MGVMSTQTARPPVDLDWNTLGFSYVRTDERYLSHWRDGAWDAGTLTATLRGMSDKLGDMTPVWDPIHEVFNKFMKALFGYSASPSTASGS